MATETWRRSEGNWRLGVSRPRPLGDRSEVNQKLAIQALELPGLLFREFFPDRFSHAVS